MDGSYQCSEGCIIAEMSLLGRMDQNYGGKDQSLKSYFDQNKE